MNVVCCCDFDEDGCAVARLVRRNDVLATLCGLQSHRYVIEAAVRIQSTMRGHILRTDKQLFDDAVCLVTRTARAFVHRRRFLAHRQACVRLQTRARGILERRRPVAQVLRRRAEDREEIIRLQMLVLRLTSIVGVVQCPTR